MKTALTCLFCEDTNLVASTKVAHLKKEVGLCEKHQNEMGVDCFCKYCGIRVRSVTDHRPMTGKSLHRDHCPRKDVLP